MPVLLNHTHPAFRIYNPATGGFAVFVGGKLEIEEDDPDYAVVMAEAAANPNIVVYASVSTCRFCGEALKSKAAVEAHVKDFHYDKYLADAQASFADTVNREIKSREGFACDVCKPVQTFGTEEDLLLHVKAFHTAPPALDEAGNEIGGSSDNAAATVEATVPAAKKK